MNKSTRSVSRKSSARPAVKSARRSSIKSKVAAAPRAKARKSASPKSTLGLTVASPRARRLVSKVKRVVNAITR